MSAPRGIPTSRAYWELQAEKLMNRIFDPADTIDIGAASSPPTDPTGSGDGVHQAPKPPRRQRARRPQPQPQPQGAEPLPQPALVPQPAATPGPRRPQRLAVLAIFAGTGLITATGGMVAVGQWSRFQESLQQERNLLLVERLRSLGPAAQPVATPEPPTLAAPPSPLAPGSATSGEGGPDPALATAAAGGETSELPPPPPQEPWIEQLGELPKPQRSAPLLRVPVSPKLAAATTEAARPRRTTPPGPLPLLVGVVGSPGKPGSAIFQMGGSTSTVGVGEAIGSSGWRLSSTDGEGVLIDHGGDVRRITIGSGG